MHNLRQAHAFSKAVRLFRIHLQNTRRLSSSQEKVIVDVDSKTGLATLAMNNAPVNGLSSDMLKSCTNAIQLVEKERDIRGAIIKSNFDGKVFCAGLNILEMYQKSQPQLLEFWGCVQDWFMSWYGCKKPVVAQINGHAPAGGCALALTCDYRVMQSCGGKSIGLNETQLGISAPFFFIEAMRNIIGRRNSEQALLLGKMFTAEEAKDVGLVDDIGKLENLTSIATTKLSQLAAVPGGAFAVTKMSLRHDVIDRLNRVRREDAENFATYVSQPKVQEMIGMYMQSLKAKKN